MKFVFIPFSIVAGLIAGALGKQLFEALWGVLDDEEPPDSEHRDISLGKLVVAEALQGAIFRVTRKVVDHQARKAFAGAVGTWPGQEAPDEK